MKSQKKTIIRTFAYVKRCKLQIFFSIILAAVTVAITLTVPILIGKAIDFIVGKGQVEFDSILKILFSTGILVIASAILQWLMNIINNYITYSIVRDIRAEAFEKIQSMPFSYIDSHSHGDLVSRIISDIDQFADGLLMGFTQFFSGVLTIVGTLGFMLSLDWRITILVVVLTPMSLFIARKIARGTYEYFRIQSEIRGEQTSFVDEYIGEQKTVAAFCHEKECINNFEEINDRYTKASIKAVFFSSLTNPSTRFVNSLIYACVTLFGAVSIINWNLITVGELTCFLSYANQYTKPFNEISGVITELQNALACASRVFELIDSDSVTDKENALELNSVKSEISLRNVYFSYTPGTKLIENFCLEVPAGTRVAIVGPTGCGKTTLINLLMRFYDIDSGEIKIDGTDIRDITRNSLRKNYGMVLQDTWIKTGTVRENIAMGRPDATDEEIIAAAKSTHADRFINRLPQGYDTVISDVNSGLSQGQKQLLCITRVMLHLPPMLILDEATSSIDTRTESIIQSSFAKMMKGRTSFIVAHRLSTIEEADIILVMKDGNIIEQGNHQQLLSKGGFYAKLYYSGLHPSTVR